MYVIKFQREAPSVLILEGLFLFYKRDFLAILERDMFERNDIMKKKPLIIILVIVVVLGVGAFFARRAIVEKTAEVATEKMFDKLSQNAGDALTDEQAANMKNVYKNMAESDRKKVTKIVSDHVDAATVKKATDALANGDTQTLKALADSELSESEKETMKDLYKKYVLEQK
jgi:hypothetical protein